ncbi:VWA domain-containing protein [Marinobacter zhejiangensis]|nr:vWA domain-containing protein [Marinobacter zhejiangensis]
MPQIPEGRDVRIIVDISGSMKQTDPLNLRQPAVRLLARILPGDSTAGIWTFGQYVNMLVPHGAVNDAWRERAIERSRQINSVALRTNLGKALEVASDSYFTQGDLSNTHFILLTDGKIDVSDDGALNDQERARVLSEVLRGLSEAGATIHTIGLSEAADINLLRAFSDQTGGNFSLAESAEELNHAFLRSLNSAVPQEQIPLEGNSFLVDDGVEEFTALIFGGATSRGVTLVSPGGEEQNSSRHQASTRWFREPGYELITVTDPDAGEWSVQGALGDGSQVTVVSNLKMVLSPLPTRFTEQHPVVIEAVFYDQADPITDPEFLGVIDVTVTLTSADGRSGTKTLSADQPPQDGVYRDEISRLPFAGEFTLEVVGNGKTFSRKYSQTLTFDVAEPEQSVLALPDGDDVTGSDLANSTMDSVEPDLSPVTPAIAPIDVAQVELPSPIAPVEADAPANLESDGEGLNAWYLVGGSVVGLVVLAAGLLLVWRQKANSSGVDAAEPEGGDEVLDTDEPAIPELDEQVIDEEEFGLVDFDLSEVEGGEDEGQSQSHDRDGGGRNGGQ